MKKLFKKKTEFEWFGVRITIIRSNYPLRKKDDEKPESTEALQELQLKETVQDTEQTSLQLEGGK